MLIVDRLVGNIAASFAHKKISYNEIDAKTMEIAKELDTVTKDEFNKLGLELTDFRIEDINFTEKTEKFIEKVTSKSADVAAINKTKDIDSEAMDNYSQLEKLDIAKKAAENE
jgi:membrane protease subunit (stomatin/prohibitin family)